MATSTKIKLQQPQNENRELVSQTSQTPMSKEEEEFLQGYAGAGLSNRREDNIVPLAYLVQSNSKIAQRGTEQYVPGAKGGDIWLRNEEPECAIVDGESGLSFIPCWFETSYLEWLPGRAGFFARHRTMPKEARAGMFEDENGVLRRGVRMPSGNIIQESKEYSGLIVGLEWASGPLGYTIPFMGSNLRVGQRWMSTLRNERLPNSQDPAPSFTWVWKIETRLQQRDNNAWFMYRVGRQRRATLAELKLAAPIFMAFRDGEKTSEAHDASGFEDGEYNADGGGANTSEI